MDAGGAVSVHTPYASLKISNSLFSNNTVRAGNRWKPRGGGAIYSNGNVTIENSAFNANSANQGGMLYAEDGSYTTIRNTSSKGNVATNSDEDDGDIHSYGHLFIDRSSFIGLKKFHYGSGATVNLIQ